MIDPGFSLPPFHADACVMSEDPALSAIGFGPPLGKPLDAKVTELLTRKLLAFAISG